MRNRKDIVREMHNLQMKRMSLGTQDFREIKKINDRLEALGIEWKETFSSNEAEREFKQKLKSNKPKWSGSYTDWLGWGRKYTWTKDLDTPVSEKKLILN